MMTLTLTVFWTLKFLLTSETDQHEGKFDNTKGVIRNRSSKYDRQHNIWPIESTKRQTMVS